MSYDLFFRSRTVGEQLLLADFTNYFSDRRFFEIQGPQAWYTNQDSGIYFSFEYASNISDEEMESESVPRMAITLAGRGRDDRVHAP